jgi:diguanylate cyclase (GGDEF)-like protein
MKLRNKSSLFITLCCALFIAITIFGAIRSSLLFFVPISVVFFLAIFIFYRFFIIRRIEKLNKKLGNLTENQEFLPDAGNDEISAIETQLHELYKKNANILGTLKNQLNSNTDELQKAQNELRRIAAVNIALIPDEKKPGSAKKYQDDLLDLPNQTYFNEALNKAISHSKRHQKILAILIIDIDGFKEINEKLGPRFGDYLLAKIGKRLEKTLRTEDTVAKLDADEFIILLSDIGKPKFASIVAEKILRVCSRPIKDIFVTVSIGISIYPNDGDSLEALLSNAEAALYKAKYAGVGKYQFYTHELDTEAREFIRLETDLQSSILKNELILYYQPKLNLKKGSITGLEALVRWEHPELGLLSPAQFIPIAEDIGFITQLGEWTLREACKMNKFWQDEGYEHFTISLNLSPKQFQDPEIAKKIVTILEETELNAQFLELEISEAIVLENIKIAKERLEEIKAIGVQLSIDRFGAGNTSFSHLKGLPINAIKIDQSFIRGVPNNPNDVAITNAFIALAHNLGLEVVAEGVETAEQVQYLSNQNCDMIQGYFLSHPLPAQKIMLQFKKLMDRTLF